MSTSTVRTFFTALHAEEAVRLLRARGFEPDSISYFTPAMGAESGTSVSAALEAGRRLSEDATACGEALRQGRSLVAVRATFGRGEEALDILEGCGGQPLRAPAAQPKPDWYRSAPLSASLSIPPVVNCPAPLSEVLGLPLLSPRSEDGAGMLGMQQLTSAKFALFGRSALSKKAAPLSSMLGLGLLSKKAAPLSSMLALPLLARCGAPLSALLGWRTLSEGNTPTVGATPLSSTFGLKVLSRNPSRPKVPLSPLTNPRFAVSSMLGLSLLSKKAAPLSSMLGLGLLSKKAAPLSSMLGLGLLSKKGAPLSSATGFSTLCNCAAPFSSAFGIPTLLRL